MAPLRREDFLLRQLKAVAAMLARIVGLRVSGRVDEARVELENAYTELLGSRGELIRRVDEATAARLLGSREAVVALADLLRQEALLEEDHDRRAQLEERASRVRGALPNEDRDAGV
jgi:hypothetical protein